MHAYSSLVRCCLHIRCILKRNSYHERCFSFTLISFWWCFFYVCEFHTTIPCIRRAPLASWHTPPRDALHRLPFTTCITHSYTYRYFFLSSNYVILCEPARTHSPIYIHIASAGTKLVPGILPTWKEVTVLSHSWYAFDVQYVCVNSWWWALDGCIFYYNKMICNLMIFLYMRFS